jgi:hypothetical protein
LSGALQYRWARCVTGPPEVTFQNIAGVARLNDGRIVVADRGTQEIRYFSRDGSHEHTVGGRGEGPGEFSSLSDLFPMRGDSLIAYDRGTDRFTYLDPMGSVTRTERAGAPNVSGRLSDGRAVYTLYANPELSGVVDGYVRPRMAVLMVPSDTGGPETVVEAFGGGEYRATADGRVFTFRAPFAQDLVIVVRDEHVYAIINDGSEILVAHARQGVERLVRMAEGSTRIPDNEIEAYRTAALESYGTPSIRQELHESVLRGASFPEFMPTFSDLVVDVDGYLWARLYQLPREAEDVTWRVFSPTGEWLHDVTLPATLSLVLVGADYLLGVDVDELGVEFVHVYALERPGH